MLSISPAVRIYLAAEPVDMRKGPDGLSALVENKLSEDSFSGNIFVFVSKRGDRVKILYWDRGGFIVFYKRLEKGKFRVPKVGKACTSVELESAQTRRVPPVIRTLRNDDVVSASRYVGEAESPRLIGRPLVAEVPSQDDQQAGGRLRTVRALKAALDGRRRTQHDGVLGATA